MKVTNQFSSFSFTISCLGQNDTIVAIEQYFLQQLYMRPPLMVSAVPAVEELTLRNFNISGLQKCLNDFESLVPQNF